VKQFPPSHYKKRTTCAKVPQRPGSTDSKFVPAKDKSITPPDVTACSPWCIGGESRAGRNLAMANYFSSGCQSNALYDIGSPPSASRKNLLLVPTGGGCRAIGWVGVAVFRGIRLHQRVGAAGNPETVLINKQSAIHMDFHGSI